MSRIFRAILAATLLTAVATADDWPHWRGPNRDATTPESSRWEAGRWPPGEPAWSVSTGIGASAPLVADGRVYAFGWREGREGVDCLDLDTGEVIWRADYPAPDYGRFHAYDEQMYRGPSAAPELDNDGRLYTLGIDGDLTCWDALSGDRLWARNLYDEFAVSQRPDAGGGVRDYGYTCAPLAWGRWLLVEAGSPQGSIIALDQATGRTRWTSTATDAAGHSGGIVPLTVEGVPCAAVLTLERLLVVRLDDLHQGETAVTYPWKTHYANSIATPTVHGDSVVLTSGYNQSRTVRVRLRLGSAELVWESPRFSKVCSPVVHAGHVYFAWQRLWCLDWETGEERWNGGAFGDDASVIATSDDRLIVFGRRSLALCESAVRSPQSYTELAVQKGIGEAQSWPHVAIADGRIICRDRDGALMCFDLRR